MGIRILQKRIISCIFPDIFHLTTPISHIPTLHFASEVWFNDNINSITQIKLSRDICYLLTYLWVLSRTETDTVLHVCSPFDSASWTNLTLPLLTNNHNSLEEESIFLLVDIFLVFWVATFWSFTTANNHLIKYILCYFIRLQR